MQVTCHCCGSDLIIRQEVEVVVGDSDRWNSVRPVCAQCGAFELYAGEEHDMESDVTAEEADRFEKYVQHAHGIVRWARRGDTLKYKRFERRPMPAECDIDDDDIPF